MANMSKVSAYGRQQIVGLLLDRPPSLGSFLRLPLLFYFLYAASVGGFVC